MQRIKLYYDFSSLLSYFYWTEVLHLHMHGLAQVEYIPMYSTKTHCFRRDEVSAKDAAQFAKIHHIMYRPQQLAWAPEDLTELHRLAVGAQQQGQLIDVNEALMTSIWQQGEAVTASQQDDFDGVQGYAVRWLAEHELLDIAPASIDVAALFNQGAWQSLQQQQQQAPAIWTSSKGWFSGDLNALHDFLFEGSPIESHGFVPFDDASA